MSLRRSLFIPLYNHSCMILHVWYTYNAERDGTEAESSNRNCHESPSRQLLNMLENVSCILCGFSAVFQPLVPRCLGIKCLECDTASIKKKKNPRYTVWQSVSLNQCSCPHVNRSKPSIYLLVMPSPPFHWVPLLPPQPPPGTGLHQLQVC